MGKRDVRTPKARRDLEWLRRRYRKLVSELKRYRDDIDHWNRAHPNEQLIAYDDGEMVGLLATIAAQLSVTVEQLEAELARRKFGG